MGDPGLRYCVTRRPGAAFARLRALVLGATALALIMPATAGAGSPPAIRSSDSNSVPGCVTPDRLMAFISERNNRLNARFKDIASYYKRSGEKWHVRWDYAVFQMILETNYLSYRQGNGRRGDVWENQNNFAGIGATGRGARGERFPDVETGVEAQIQHLVAYSGEKIDEPVARRTRENQDEIVEKSLRLKRTVTFADLTRRWATDRHYARSIEFVANLYRERYCSGKEEAAAQPGTAPSASASASGQQAAADEPTPISTYVPVADPTKLRFRPPSGLGGPKPSRLGAPAAEALAEDDEVLPWLKVKPAGTKDPKKASRHRKSAPPGTADGSARTIWTRREGPATLPSPERQPARTDDAAGSVPQAGPKAEPQAATGSRDVPPSVPAPTNAQPTLPTFRISPVAEAPSRLGGPVPPSPSAAAPMRCHILEASYGGTKTLLLRSRAPDGNTNLTALTVLDGFEKTMVETYAKASGVTADIVGEYPNKDAALGEARSNCPNG